MILVGSQRAGASNLANHLMNDRDNDHVTLFEVRGFVARDLHGALAEAHAISKGTKCEQFLFSLSVNPPKYETVTEQELEDAIERAEQKLGLTDQPRAIVFHEKDGRRHAHAVWSRIDARSMTAINMAHFKTRLTILSRELYLEHGWDLPNGLRRDGGRSPLNFTLAEWQQAKRLKLDPREIKQSFQEAWKQSDGLKGFQNALEERGYFLAKGDRRGFIALNVDGEVFSVPRMLNIKTKEVKAKLGAPEELTSVDEKRELIQSRVSDKLHGFIDDVDRKHVEDFQPLKRQRAVMTKAQREERAKLKAGQKQRAQQEAQDRSGRLSTGLRGLWEKVSGQLAKVRKQNEREAWESAKRDQKQRDDLVKAHLKERQGLQAEIDKLRRKHAQDRRLLAREIGQSVRVAEQTGRKQVIERQHDLNRRRGLSLG